MGDTAAYTGLAGMTSAGSVHNIDKLHRERTLDERRTAIPVQIKATHGGGVGPAPTVDVLPLIDSVDGLGNRIPHGVIFGIPTARSQTANGAIINDPQPGDMGMLHVSDRDISQLKITGQQAAPGSGRRGGLADGIYHGAVLIPGNPTQYVQFRADGVTIADTNGNLIETFAGKICVVPKAGSLVYLGGDGVKGSYDFVLTPSGPSINTKTRTG